ncbi:MAG: hypothetical protein AAF975_08450, partial [Spirochaetota bacterium]
MILETKSIQEPLIQGLAISDEKGNIWLDDTRFIDWGQAHQKVYFYLFGNISVVCLSQYFVAANAPVQFWGDSFSCSSSFRTQARICPVRSSCLHCSNENTNEDQSRRPQAESFSSAEEQKQPRNEDTEQNSLEKSRCYEPVSQLALHVLCCNKSRPKLTFLKALKLFYRNKSVKSMEVGAVRAEIEEDFLSGSSP